MCVVCVEKNRTSFEIGLGVVDETGGLQSEGEISTIHIAELEVTRAEQEDQIEKLTS